MPSVSLDGLPEPVREFFLSLPREGEDTIIEWQGQEWATVRTGIIDPEGRWTEAKNVRRLALIDREFTGLITSAEAIELEDLQEEMRRYRHRMYPLPLAETRRILEDLERKENEAKQ